MQQQHQISLIKKFIFGISISIVAFVCILICLELQLRLSGKKPFQYASIGQESVIMEADPVLGWKNKPGIYTHWPGTWDDGKKKTFTVWPGGMRATAQHLLKKDTQILILGCSFTQGWALSDEETFAWKLQEQFPDIEFLNYGTGGYGTYQSLLLLEQYLKDSPQPPRMVLYGFAGFHAMRNVASHSWVRMLVTFSKRGHVNIPYCLIGNNGDLKRYPAFSYPVNFLNTHSAAIDFLVDRYCSWRSKKRELQEEIVTRKLLLEMDAVSRKKGSRLVVLFLDSRDTNKGAYMQFFSEHKIDFIDCTPPETVPFDLGVKNEGHPSGMLNSYWAACISKGIADRMHAFAGTEKEHVL